LGFWAALGQVVVAALRYAIKGNTEAKVACSTPYQIISFGAISTIISALDKCSGLLAPEEPFCLRNKVIPASLNSVYTNLRVELKGE
jgi:hypothetical protein